MLFRSEPMRRLIVRSAELHLNHIATSGDPFEMGSARPLDFGHWAAHKIEAMTSHRLRHGEAVAIGMVLAFDLSVKLGLCPGQDAQRFRRHLSVHLRQESNQLPFFAAVGHAGCHASANVSPETAR